MGLYVGQGGAFNPQYGRSLKPDSVLAAAGRNAYTGGDISFYDRAVIFTVPIAAGLALAPFTGGMSLWAAGALMGSVGGAFAGFSGGYIEGGWSGGASGAGIGALAGAAGGALGGLAGAGARTFVNGWCNYGVGARIAGGFIQGAAEGGTFGFTDGFIRGGLSTRSWSGAFYEGGINAAMGLGIGGGLGAIFHQVCFVAGTQVVVAIGNDGAWVTKNIEDIKKGDLVLSRDQNDPNAPLVLSRVEETYRRIADHLQIVTIRSSNGEIQVIETTDEHPFNVVGKGWTKAEELKAGDQVSQPNLSGTVISSIREEHPEGVPVYNMKVENTHSYYVRSEDSTAEPVWVHNADYNNTKGTVFENLRESAVSREGGNTFFRAGRSNGRRGGLDLGILDDGKVILEEVKFQNRLQYDDFTAITDNLKSNVQELFDSLAGSAELSRVEKAIVRRTLGEFITGGLPDNLSIRVVSGKSTIGSRLQTRIRANTGGIPVSFI